MKFGPKVKLSIGSGFKELDVPNLSKSLSQIEEVMNQGKLKKGKRIVCYTTLGISLGKTRRREFAKANKLAKK